MLTDQFSKHLPLGIDQGEGEKIQVAASACLYFSQRVSQWEVQTGQRSSFDYIHWIVVLGDNGPEKIFRAERHGMGVSTALCSITQNGRHSFLDELPVDISRTQFQNAVCSILSEG